MGLRLRLHPLVDGSELLRALHLALDGRLGDFHHVARAELHLLLEGSRGDAVQLLALGGVADVHTHDVLADVEVSRRRGTLLLVLQLLFSSVGKNVPSPSSFTATPWPTSSGTH